MMLVETVDWSVTYWFGRRFCPTRVRSVWVTAARWLTVGWEILNGKTFRLPRTRTLSTQLLMQTLYALQSSLVSLCWIISG